MDSVRVHANDRTRTEPRAFRWEINLVACMMDQAGPRVLSGWAAAKSAVVAARVDRAGKREALGVDVGMNVDRAIRLAFLRSRAARGLAGVELAISDAHQGLKDAIAMVPAAASWQRCRSNIMTILLSNVPRRAQA